jgi:hypothetical protein
MKRALSLLIVLVMVMCMVAACGGTNSGNTTGTKVTTTNSTTASTTTQQITEPKDESLLVYLNFDFDNLIEEGGVSYFEDMTGNGNHAYVGGRMVVADGPDSDYGEAIELDTVGNFLTIKHNDMFNFKAEDEYTIDFWFQADTEKLYSQHTWPCPFTKGSPNNTSYFGCWINAGKVYYGTGTYDIENKVNVTGNKNAVVATGLDDNWHHFIAVQKDGKIYTYLDGKAGATELAKDVSNTWDFYLGGKVGEKDGADVLQQFFGCVDEFKIYNRALSTEEITGVYPVVKDESKLVLNLDFAEIANGVIADKSGKGNNATVTGEAAIVDGAVVFDADGEYLTIASADNLKFGENDSFILEFKYRIDAAGGSWPCILSKGDKNNGWLGVWMNNGIVWGGDTGNYITTPDMTTGTWHTIQVVKDASAKAIYIFIDGALTTQIFKNMVYLSDLDIFIGGNTYAGKGDNATTKVQQFFGAIDDFKIYNYGTEAIAYEK